MTSNFKPFNYSIYSLITLIVSFTLLLNSCSKKASTSSTPGSEKKTSNETTAKNNEANAIPKPVVKKIPTRFDEKINFLKENSAWVDSVFNSLTLEERIAQLIMFDAYSNLSRPHLDTLVSLVEKHKLGGLIFFQGGPGRQINMINRLQSVSKVPLLIAMDAETGIGMRLDSTNRYPYQMTLGAISDEKLIYEMGKAIAKDVKRVGMQVNFAPVLDINNNSSNPVIGMRSFGENKNAVTSKSLAYMRGLQDHQVLATAKHFPGHGDTDIDSHEDLPLIRASRARLDTLELHPFKELIKEGLGGVMVAHMNIPALDTTPKLPSTLSKPIITGLLKNELGFKGVIFTDAMVMEGVAKYYPSGTAEPMAVIAGNDVLEKMKNARVAIRSIKEAVERGEIKQADIDEKCKKILAVKELVGLNNYHPVDKANLYSDLKNHKTDSLIAKIYESAATLLKNEGNLMPLSMNQKIKVATVSINTLNTTTFQKTIAPVLDANNFILPLKSSAAGINKVKKELQSYDVVILAIHDSRGLPGFKLNYSAALISFINEMCKSNRVIITLFGNPYSLNSLSSLNQANSIIVLYENNWYTQKVASDILLGKTIPRGKLPVTVNSDFPVGFHLQR